MKISEIRIKFKDQIDKVGSSIGNYMEWNKADSSQNYSCIIQILDKSAWDFYNNFITRCVVEDINDLKELIDTTKENNND